MFLLYLCKKFCKSNHIILIRMKKRKIWMLILMVVAAIALQSCRTSESCAAYGEARNFQVGETR